MATSAAVAAAAYVLGRANEQIFMCCAPSPTFDQNVRHIRIQSHTISQHTLFSFWSCELDNATIPDGEHVQFWDVTQFGVLSFSFDVDVVAAAMQMPENCERFSNFRSFVHIEMLHEQFMDEFWCQKPIENRSADGCETVGKGHCECRVEMAMRCWPKCCMTNKLLHSKCWCS